MNNRSTNVIKILLAFTINLLVLVAATSSNAQSYRVAANPDGDAFSIDNTGRIWVRDALGTRNFGVGPGGGIVDGMAVVQAASGYKAVFVRTADQHLQEFFKYGNTWLWADHGVPPCGALAGSPAVATSGD